MTASAALQDPVPLHEAIQMVISAAGRLLLADAEEPARCNREVRGGFTRLGHALFEYQRACQLTHELVGETGLPLLRVMDGGA